jgi:hypothetical protein
MMSEKGGEELVYPPPGSNRRTGLHRGDRL